MRQLFKTLITCLPMATLFANPEGGTFAVGTGEIMGSGTANLSVRTDSSVAVVDWQSFSVDTSEVTTFTSSTNTVGGFNVLNRVACGDTASSINGTINASGGNVTIVNQNGFVLGTEAKVTGRSVIMGTINVSNDQYVAFANGTADATFSGTCNKTLTNKGKITATNGDVILLGYKIANDGTITATKGAARLGAGTEILVKPSGTERIFIKSSGTGASGTGVDQNGVIVSKSAFLKADGGAYNLAINQRGTINASACTTTEGKVYLVATGTGEVQNIGEITKSCSSGNGADVKLVGTKVSHTSTGSINSCGQSGGGSVQLGGSIVQDGTTITSAQVYHGPNATIDSSTSTSGDGGTVTLEGTTSVLFQGTITAKGGTSSGDGGTVTLKSDAYVGGEGVVNTAARASSGTAGTYVVNSSKVQVAGDANSGTNFQPPDWSTATTVSNLSLTSLQNSLANSGVSVIATGTSDTGDINLVQDFTWSSGNKLTLNADNNIQMDVKATQTGTSSSSNVVFDLTGNKVYIGKSTQTQSVPAEFYTASGIINVTATDTFGIFAGLATNAYARVQTDNGAVNVNAGTTTANANGDIKILAGSATGTYAHLYNKEAAMDINFGGDITIQGGNSGSSMGQIFTNNTVTFDSLSSSQGDINVYAGSCSPARIEAGGGAVNIGKSVKPVDINIVGGNASSENYAIIGTVTTTGADIDANVSGDITITGGSAGAENKSGFLIAGGTSNTLVITADDLTLTSGNLLGADGTNNHAVVDNKSTGGSVSITLSGDAQLYGSIGGNTSTNAFISGGTTTMSVAGDLSLTGGTTLNSKAYITAVSGIDLNVGGNILVQGGSNAVATAQIYVSGDGDIVINGLGTDPGDIRVLGGTTGTENALASIHVVGDGDIFFGTTKVFDNLIVTGGGEGADTRALIYTNQTGDITATFAKDISVTGGSGEKSDASLKTSLSNGAGNITLVVDDLRHTGGSGASSSAGVHSATQGDIDITASGGIFLNSGSGANSFTEIYTKNGFITTSSGTNHEIIGGDGSNAYARIVTDSGNRLSINSGKDVIITTGSTTGSHAHIKNNNGPLTVNSSRHVRMKGSCSVPNLASIEVNGSLGAIDIVAGANHLMLENAAVYSRDGFGIVNVKAANNIVVQNCSTVRNDVLGGYVCLGTNKCYCNCGDGHADGATFLDTTSSFVTAGGDVRLFTTFFPQTTVMNNPVDEYYCVQFTNCNCGPTPQPGVNTEWMKTAFMYELFYRLRRWTYLDWYLLGLTDFWSTAKNSTGP